MGFGDAAGRGLTLHAIALWVWHLPGPYQSTLHSELMHTLQHLSFVSTALIVAALVVTSCDRASGDDSYHLTNAPRPWTRAAMKRYG